MSVIAASTNRQVNFLVLLAAPATNLKQMLLTQRRLIGTSQGQSPTALAASEPIIARIFDAIATSDSNEDAAQRIRLILTPEALGALTMQQGDKENFVHQMANTWMRQFLRLDPSMYLKKVHVPVLALNGAIDRQVEPKANLASIKASVARGTEVTTTELPGLNHMFQSAKTGAPSEYGTIQESIAPSALEMVTAWIKRGFP